VPVAPEAENEGIISDRRTPLPYVFSATTKLALKRMLTDFGDFLTVQEQTQDLGAYDLAFTLNSRRTIFPCRAAFSARGLEDLGGQIRDAMKTSEWEPIAVVSDAQQKDPTPRILGVFAGQGAQWPGMARRIIQDIPFASRRLAELDGFLASLPDEADRPSWSLREELGKVQGSRLHLAEFAQPACTALQILQVDLLDEANIHFSAVVGHSSGEIAAAYAAGLLSARDAIVVAYYRGIYSSRLAGAGADVQSRKVRGAMMAIGTSMADAEQLLSAQQFRGRVTVAAHNSPTSVTLSGDEDAILEVKEILVADGKFARLLRVDQAYHSHHMEPCLVPYVEALKRAGVQVMPPGSSDNPDRKPNPTWYSSVFGLGTEQQVMKTLDNTYWAQNMGQTVLFTDAVEAAVRAQTTDLGQSFSMAVGIGPHGALRGPLDEILAGVSSTNGNDAPLQIPYADVLTRNKDDSLSLMQGIGQIWAQHASGLAAKEEGLGVDLGRFQTRVYRLVSQVRRPFPSKNLPSYPWDHTRTFWHESRRSRVMRTRSKPAHPLLGTLSPDSAATDLSWHNLLRVTDLPWLRGHRLQGQIIYPAAGYMAAAIDAALYVADSRQRRAKKIELKDMWIGKAIVFEDESTSGGVEVFTTLRIGDDKGDLNGDNIVEAQFRFRSAVLGANSTDASLNASGSITITLFDGAGEEDMNESEVQVEPLLSSQQDAPPLLVDVGENHFYSELNQLGYHYTESFRSLFSARRKLGYARAALNLPVREEMLHSEKNLLLHPGPMDALFQAIFLAYAWPGDGRLWSMHVPVAVERLQIDVEQVRRANLDSTHYMIEADITIDPSVSGRPQEGLGGEVGIFTADGSRGLVLAEGVRLAPLATASENEDVNMFLETVEGVAFPDCTLAMTSAETGTVDRATDAETELGWLLERIAHFYLARLALEITPQEEAQAEWHHQKLMNFARHAAREVASGRQPYAKSAWSQDTHETLKRLMDKHMDKIDVQLMRSVGEHLPAAVRGETVILQHMVQDGMLNRSYEETLGVKPYSDILASVIEQIALVHPSASILEIGAGTGGATKRILSRIPHAFDHYTFTDISSGFFEAAESIFPNHVNSGRLSFRTLDIERDPVSGQGFEEHSYDIVLASFVLHATADLENTLRNARRLLRPGGYLVLLEMTSNDTMRLSLTMGGLEGWWLGAETGRPWSPCVSTMEWHHLLKRAGFTGVEQSTPELDPLARPFAVLVSRALDDRLDLLLEPSTHAPTDVSSIPQLLIIAGSSLPFTSLAERVCKILQPYSPKPVAVVTGGLKHFMHKHRQQRLGTEGNPNEPNKSVTVLYLADLDERTLLEDIELDAFEGLKELFALSPGQVLWVTHGARHGRRPYAVASVGLGRALMMEYSHIMMQFLDFAVPEPDARSLADDLLRLRILHSLEQQQESGNSNTLATLLWSREPEVSVDRDGRRWISRIVPHRQFNEAYNSARRTILAPVDPAKDRVEMYDEFNGDRSGSNPQIVVRTARVEGQNSKNPLSNQVRPRYTVPLAVQAGGRTWHASTGFTEALSPGASDVCPSAVVVLSDRLGTIVTPLSKDSLLPWEQDPLLGDDATPSCLGAIANTLVASLMAREAEQDCRLSFSGLRNRRESSAVTILLLLEPDTSLAREVSMRATASDSWKIMSLTSSSGRWSSAPDLFTFIDPHASKRVIRKCLGLDVPCKSRIGTMVIASSPGTSSQGAHVLARLLESSLPEMARVRTKVVGDLLEDAHNQHIEREQEGASTSALTALFRDAVAGVSRSIQGQDRQIRCEVDLISPGDYANNRRTTLSTKATAAIDWSSTSGATLTATARPLDSVRPLLRGDRSYLLLGLGGKGGLGSSLAEYLVRQGARYIILTSRNPGVDSQLTEEYAKQGVRIQGFANDITDEASLKKLVQNLRDSPDWPPIGGVANGAMVLADVSLQNMTHDQMVRVLRPKIDGSILVDKIFHSDPLDFFILFSSLSCVLGNRGQANYDAANMFLVGLAAQRRARGVVASVVDIGAIMGMGYMAREVKDQTLKQMVGAGFNKMSERDFFMTFAHGMLAGCSSSSNRYSYEVVTGLNVPQPTDEFQPGWVTNPRFSHMVARRRVADRQQAKKPLSAHQAESTRDLLKRSKTLADVSLVVTAALLNKMTHMLQLGGEEAGDQEALLLRGTSSLGVDSLVAVEIRSWMLREFEVDMPVFKILADTTIGNMVDFTLEALPESVTPCLDKDSKDNAITAASLAEPKTGNQGDSEPSQSPTQSYLDQHSEVVKVSTDSGGESSSNPSRALTSTLTAASTSPSSLPSSIESTSRPCSRSSLESISPPSSLDRKVEHGSKMDPSLSRNSLNTVSSAIRPPARRKVQKIVPMSYGQSRFWLMSELCPGSTACNVVNDIEITAELNKDALARAVRSLGARHEALRTAFVKGTDSVAHEVNLEYPQQAILKESHLKLEMIEAASSREVDELFEELHNADYSLETGELMKMILVSVSPRLHHLLIGYHHINMDSFSMAILMKEMLQLYSGQELPMPRIQQANLALHERSQLQGGCWVEQMEFWRKKFANKVPEPLPILAVSPASSTRSRPGRITYRAHSHKTRIPTTTAQHVRSMCRSAGVTPFHLYAAVLQVLLTRLAGLDHVVIGMADGNRGSLDLPGATEAVGNFLNIVPLPLDTPRGDTSIHKVLQNLQATVIQAMSNSALPFEMILEQVRTPRSTNYSALFQVFIDYKKVTEKLPLPGGGGTIEGKRYLLSKTPYDLILDIIDTPAGDALVELSAQDGLYTSEEALKLLNCYVNLLNSISQSDSQTSIGEASMFDAHELEHALQLGQGKSIHHLAP
jgi:hybrid polyketide synthase / nonribosomal peptide synthetase ACE1